MRLKALLLCLAFPFVANAQDSGWRDQHGRPVPDTDSMKSKSGFAASLVVTPDEDWKAKWETPSEHAPSFNLAREVPYGKRVFALLFYANPMPTNETQVKISCDVKITSPLGKVSFDQRNMTCFSGRVMGSLTNMYLSTPVVAFSGDPGDPAGAWTIEANVRDEVRKVELPLRHTFVLRK